MTLNILLHFSNFLFHTSCLVILYVKFLDLFVTLRVYVLEVWLRLLDLVMLFIRQIHWVSVVVEV